MATQLRGSVGPGTTEGFTSFNFGNGDLWRIAEDLGYSGPRRGGINYLTGTGTETGERLTADQIFARGPQTDMYARILERLSQGSPELQNLEPGTFQLNNLYQLLAEKDPTAAAALDDANFQFARQNDGILDKISPIVPWLFTGGMAGMATAAMGGFGAGTGAGIETGAGSGAFTGGGGGATLAETAGGAFGGAGTGGGTSSGFSILDLLKKYGLAPTKASSLFSIGSGLYGMYKSHEMQKLAEQAMKADNPFGPHREQYAQMLDRLYANPKTITRMPGYKAGLDAVTRKMASQGYLGSGNMMAALQKYGGDFFNAEAARLAQLAGAQFSPNSGATLAGHNYSNDLASKALASIGYGLRGFDDIFATA